MDYRFVRIIILIFLFICPLMPLTYVSALAQTGDSEGVKLSEELSGKIRKYLSADSIYRAYRNVYLEEESKHPSTDWKVYYWDDKYDYSYNKRKLLRKHGRVDVWVRQRIAANPSEKEAVKNAHEGESWKYTHGGSSYTPPNPNSSKPINLSDFINGKYDTTTLARDYNGYQLYDHTLMLYQLDCSEDRFRVLELLDYDLSGHLLWKIETPASTSAGWERNVPGTVSEIITELLCK